MLKSKSNFLDKVLGRIGRLDAGGLQTVVQHLARERSFLETLFNAIEDGVLVVDEHGRILYFNLAVSELLGWRDEAVEGQPVSRYLPELDWEQLAARDRSGNQSVVRHEFEIHYPRSRFLRMYAAPLEGGSPDASGLALILHDATEARQKTFEAIESERIQALTLLAASVAHEIGNPLNALHIHMQLMERELRKLKRVADRGWNRGDEDEDDHAVSVSAAAPARSAVGRDPVRGHEPDGTAERSELRDISRRLEKYLGVSKGEIARLDYIVTQFLHAIRPSKPRMSAGSLNQMVRETLELLRPELDNRGLTVHDQCAKRLPQAPLDAGQIKQVLVNLIKNAMQAMTRGGELTLKTGSEPEGVWVSVSDTGDGIASDQINRIFEPFFTTKKKGSGLGLMIVQRIVREHGGRIELDSQAGRGTRFRLWFPRRDQSIRLLAESSPANAENLEGELILDPESIAAPEDDVADETGDDIEWH